MVTGTVADEFELPPLSELLSLELLLEPLALELPATGLTAIIVPRTVEPFGISIVTRDPTTASLCELAARPTVATSRVELV